MKWSNKEVVNHKRERFLVSSYCHDELINDVRFVTIDMKSFLSDFTHIPSIDIPPPYKSGIAITNEKEIYGALENKPIPMDMATKNYHNYLLESDIFANVFRVISWLGKNEHVVDGYYLTDCVYFVLWQRAKLYLDKTALQAENRAREGGAFYNLVLKDKRLFSLAVKHPLLAHIWFEGYKKEKWEKEVLDKTLEDMANMFFPSKSGLNPQLLSLIAKAPANATNSYLSDLPSSLNALIDKQDLLEQRDIDNLKKKDWVVLEAIGVVPSVFCDVLKDVQFGKERLLVLAQDPDITLPYDPEKTISGASEAIAIWIGDSPEREALPLKAKIAGTRQEIFDQYWGREKYSQKELKRPYPRQIYRNRYFKEIYSLTYINNLQAAQAEDAIFGNGIAKMPYSAFYSLRQNNVRIATIAIDEMYNLQPTLTLLGRRGANIDKEIINMVKHELRSDLSKRNKEVTKLYKTLGDLLRIYLVEQRKDEDIHEFIAYGGMNTIPARFLKRYRLRKEYLSTVENLMTLWTRHHHQPYTGFNSSKVIKWQPLKPKERRLQQSKAS